MKRRNAMFSNLPTMLQQQDFQASNRDMLEAARGGKMLSDAPKHLRCIGDAKIKYDRRLDLRSVNF